MTSVVTKRSSTIKYLTTLLLAWLKRNL